jgi:hypothetical protein
MLPSAIAPAWPAGSLLPGAGLFHAAGIILAAIRGIWAAAALLTRKRLAWRTDLDMPIGLTPGQPHDTATTTRIIFADPDAPRPAGPEDAWLVLLTIINTGLTPIRAEDFTAPLAFTFPGRQVRGAQINARPVARTRPGRPASRAPARPDVHAGPGADAGHMQLTGQYRLKPSDNVTMMFILTGTPAGTPVQQHGSLPGGRITTKPLDPDAGSRRESFGGYATAFLAALSSPRTISADSPQIPLD